MFFLARTPPTPDYTCATYSGNVSETTTRQKFIDYGEEVGANMKEEWTFDGHINEIRLVRVFVKWLKYEKKWWN